MTTETLRESEKLHEYGTHNATQQKAALLCMFMGCLAALATHTTGHKRRIRRLIRIYLTLVFGFQRNAYARSCNEEVAIGTVDIDKASNPPMNTSISRHDQAHRRNERKLQNCVRFTSDASTRLPGSRPDPLAAPKIAAPPTISRMKIARSMTVMLPADTMGSCASTDNAMALYWDPGSRRP